MTKPRQQCRKCKAPLGDFHVKGCAYRAYDPATDTDKGALLVNAGHVKAKRK